MVGNNLHGGLNVNEELLEVEVKGNPRCGSVSLIKVTYSVKEVAKQGVTWR